MKLADCRNENFRVEISLRIEQDGLKVSESREYADGFDSTHWCSRNDKHSSRYSEVLGVTKKTPKSSVLSEPLQIHFKSTNCFK